MFMAWGARTLISTQVLVDAALFLALRVEAPAGLGADRRKVARQPLELQEDAVSAEIPTTASTGAS